MWRSGCTALSFLTSALDGGEWSASRLRRFTAWETVPGTHLLGGWVAPRASLDAMEERSSFCRESNLAHPARSTSPYQVSCHHGLNWSSISALAWRHWGKLQYPSIRIGNVQAEVRTEYLPEWKSETFTAWVNCSVKWDCRIENGNEVGAPQRSESN
jgi:hypothetical protein